MSSVNLATDCAAGDSLASVDLAYAYFSALARPVAETESVAVASAAGRVLAADVLTRMPLPPFDHSAVDGFGIAGPDIGQAVPLRLRIAGRLAAGDRALLPLQAGETVRVFTGATIPPGVGAVVLEERCRQAGSSVSVEVAVPDGANIRRRGEDVPAGSVLIEAPAILDARHLAILTAGGVDRVTVRRKIRVAVFSNGNELCEAAQLLEPGRIYDTNRPMLLALLAGGWVEAIDAGRHPDDPALLREVYADAASRADVVISTGGAAGSDVDHIAPAILANGGMVRRYRLALRPGKPVIGGRIGETSIVGLPGNPVAALVDFMLFARPVVARAAGLAPARPRGEAAVTAERFGHAAGRTEFVPVRIAGADALGRPRLEKLGRGGSARLRPLVLADGLAEIPEDCGDLAEGSSVAFHAFAAAFAL